MAALSRIAKLSARIDALASRRVGKLSMDMLTDEAWGKIERIVGGPSDVRIPTACDHLSTQAILRYLVESGCLDLATDFCPTNYLSRTR